MTKILTIVASLVVPDDEFERANVLTQIQPVIEKLRGSLHELTSGSAAVSHSIKTERAPKAIEPAAPAAEAAPMIADADPVADVHPAAPSRHHKAEAVAA